MYMQFCHSPSLNDLKAGTKGRNSEAGTKVKKTQSNTLYKLEQFAFYTTQNHLFQYWGLRIVFWALPHLSVIKKVSHTYKLSCQTIFRPPSYK